MLSQMTLELLLLLHVFLFLNETNNAKIFKLHAN